MGLSHPRYAPDRESMLLDESMLAPGQKLVLRYSWESFYSMDAVELQIAEALAEAPHTMHPASVVHSGEGAVLDRMAKSGDVIWLRPGEALNLSFDLSSLPALEEGMVREYVLASTGQYKSGDGDESAKPLRFALGNNTPNPFNPATTIHFSLATASQVDLRVIDVRGQLVRTLVSDMRQAGEHAVLWDGRTNSREPAASGVYFYQLSAGDLLETRKMMLLK